MRHVKLIILVLVASFLFWGIINAQDKPVKKTQKKNEKKTEQETKGAVIVTVDGLSFANTLTGFFKIDDYNNYLGTALRGMFDRSVEIREFEWDRNAGNTNKAVPDLRRFLREMYERAVKSDKKFIVISHSWGTFLAYMALSYESTVEVPVEPDLFITLSSPIGTYYAHKPPLYTGEIPVNIYIYDWLGTFKFNECSGCYPRAKRMINYWAWGDVISGPLHEFCDLAEDVLLNKEAKKKGPEGRTLTTTLDWHYYTSLQNERPICNESFRDSIKDKIQWALNQPGIKKNIAEPNMVFVKGGTFLMGSDEYDESKPIHKVTLSDFYIGKYEVTQKEWENVMGSNPSSFKGANRPVENVSWNDVQEFIKKLNAKTGENYRLPTEAEWEYAARGGNKSRGYEYSGSNSIDEVAWYNGNSNSETHEVGQKQPNELGIYDMSGNVWEWCSDWYDENYYKNSPSRNPQGVLTETNRVFRGGSWKYNSANGGGCSPGKRFYSNPGDWDYYLGFRLAQGL